MYRKVAIVQKVYNSNIHMGDLSIVLEMDFVPRIGEHIRIHNMKEYRDISTYTVETVCYNLEDDLFIIGLPPMHADYIAFQAFLKGLHKSFVFKGI